MSIFRNKFRIEWGRNVKSVVDYTEEERINPFLISKKELRVCLDCGKEYIVNKNWKCNVRGFCNKICESHYRYGDCKDCGKKIINSGQFSPLGYCSIVCFRNKDPELYIKKGYKFPKTLQKRIPFNKYGMLYEPHTEDEVIVLFSKIHEKLGFKFIKIFRKEYPDCICIDENGKEIKIEFEYNSSSFHEHIGKEAECDLVICWDHDWKKCPVKVISLKEIV